MTAVSFTARLPGEVYNSTRASVLAVAVLLVDRLGILNVPHPNVYRETLRSSLQQILRSWYVWFY